MARPIIWIAYQISTYDWSVLLLDMISKDLDMYKWHTKNYSMVLLWYVQMGNVAAPPEARMTFSYGWNVTRPLPTGRDWWYISACTAANGPSLAPKTMRRVHFAELGHPPRKSSTFLPPLISLN
jgi:hypothetical protein